MSPPFGPLAALALQVVEIGCGPSGDRIKVRDYVNEREGAPAWGLCRRCMGSCGYTVKGFAIIDDVFGRGL